LAALDEQTAWTLVRAARGRGAGRVSAGPAWIETESSGTWRAHPEPTPEARQLLDLFLPVALPPELAIGQLGQSLDGRIATEGGRSRYVTGPANIVHLHRLRALVDAVVVGAATVALDDPRLTVRKVEGENPVRVILDPDGRLARDLGVFSDGGRTLVVRRAASDADPDVLALPVGPEGFEPAALRKALGGHGLRRILVEGGGVTVSRFVAAGALDRLHVCVAPLLIGSGRPALTLPPVASLDQALRPRCRHFHLGEDLLFDLELR